ncbi:MAG: nuclear transport factor 2 family protein [Candidatus Acidiferrales bacterium]
MKIARNVAVLLVILFLPGAHAARLSARPANDDQLLKVRDTVWRAWFAGDTKTLEQLVPPGTIVMSGGEKDWKDQAYVLEGSAEFRAGGGKLLRLEFPRTQIQHFGNVAVVWSNFVLETETNGKRSTSSGRATEIFLWQNGRWLNPGWHTSSQP